MRLTMTLLPMLFLFVSCRSSEGAGSEFESKTRPEGTPSEFCNPDIKLSLVKVDAEPGVKTVIVNGVDTPSSGYRWINPIDKQSARIVNRGNGIGAPNSIAFDIDLTLQKTKTKTYEFVYIRPWEPAGSEVARCRATVTKK